MEGIRRTAALAAILTYFVLPAPAQGAQCLPGEYWSGAECLICPAGAYGPGDDNQNACPASGYDGSGTGYTTSTCGGVCGAGSYSAEPASGCSVCAAGTYGLSSMDCTSCPAMGSALASAL